MSSTIDKLIKTLDESPFKFNNRLPAIEKKILDELLLLLKELQTGKDGRIVSNIANLKLVNSIRLKLEKLVVSKEYVRDLAEFARSFNTAALYVSSYYQGIFDNFNKKPYYESITKTAIDNAINSLTKVGINANVAEPIQKMLMTAVTSSQSYSSLAETLLKTIKGSDGKPGMLSKYVSTYTTTALSIATRQYMAAIHRDLGIKWFKYLGSNIETTREFCLYMTKKKWVHESEFETIISGDIDGHQVEMYNGLPRGMIAGTNATNFEVNLGGWNCRHGLYGVTDSMVPDDVKSRIKV